MEDVFFSCRFENGYYSLLIGSHHFSAITHLLQWSPKLSKNDCFYVFLQWKNYIIFQGTSATLTYNFVTR